MKFIHTADWHIGKFLKGISFIDEQEYIFKEFVKLIDDENPDAIIIAGDIYDRNIPPADAVNLFDEIVYNIISRNIPMLCVSGNHDSSDRLNFASRLLAKSSLFIATKLDRNPATVVLEDDFGEIYFTLIPYFEVAEFRDRFGYEERIDINDAVRNYITVARGNIPHNKRSVAVAHLFATGGVPSESERKFVGAVENVDAANFAEYNYTALGHLHKPQTMLKGLRYMRQGLSKNTNPLTQNPNPFVRYSGSPLKYSFDEANHNKGVTIIEIDSEGNTNVRHVNLIPRRDIRVVNGDLDELMNYPKTHDYIHAKLTTWHLYAMDKLRESAFPNILSIEFENVTKKSAAFSNISKPREGVSVIEHFADFYKYSTGHELNGEYHAAMENLLKELQA